MIQWQGRPNLEGDCEATCFWWSCTLPAGHDGLHEAWGTEGDQPHYAWGRPEDSVIAEISARPREKQYAGKTDKPSWRKS